jgi:hypothetical protein
VFLFTDHDAYDFYFDIRYLNTAELAMLPAGVHFF